MSEETCEYCGVHGGGHGSKCRLKFKEKILLELKETVFWNECDGNAGYKLISVSNVETLIEMAINKTKFVLSGRDD